MHALSQRSHTRPAGWLFFAFFTASAVAQTAALAREPKPVTFSKDSEVCVLEWTSTADGHLYSVYQLYGNGRFENRTYLNGPKPVPDSHTTTDLTPDELAIWLDDIVDSGLYAYSRSDIDRRIAATGRVRMLVADRGTEWVRIRFQQPSGERAAPTPMSNAFVGDGAWNQADRYPEIPELAAVPRMWQRFHAAGKAGVPHPQPLAPAPLPILSWSEEERARAGWTSD